MSGYREKTARDIANGIIDYDNMLSSLPDKFKNTVKGNYKHIEKYGKQKGLTQAQIQELKNMEVLVARVCYLQERNEQNAKTNDDLAKRDTARNNAEIEAISKQYNLKAEMLGNHPSALNNFIEKENTKKAGR